MTESTRGRSLAMQILSMGFLFLAGFLLGAALRDGSKSERSSFYARGALSVAMRDGCQKQFDLAAKKYPLGVAYGSAEYRAYTFEHGEPRDCEDVARILREIGEK